MPALGFKKELAPKILDGSKTFTLRELRKDGRDPKTGQMLYMFTGQRTKQCKKIGEKRCRFATMILLCYGGLKITGFKPITKRLQPEHLNHFAQADGFENYDQFRQFHKIHTSNTVRELWLISWATREELIAGLNLENE